MEEIKGITFERGLNHNYMVIKGSENKPIDYQVKMMTENVIRNILKLEIHMVDGHYDYYYEISSKQALRSVYEHKQISCDELIKIIEGTLNAYRMISEYMLCEEHMVLDPSYIFINADTMNLEYLFYPECTSSIDNNFCLLSEFILDKVDHSDKGAVMLAYNLYKLIKSENYTLSDIQNLIETANSSVEKIIEVKEENIIEEDGSLDEVTNFKDESIKSKFKVIFGKKKKLEKGKKIKSAYDTEKELFNNKNSSDREEEKEQNISGSTSREMLLDSEISEKVEAEDNKNIICTMQENAKHKLVKKGPGKEIVYNVNDFPLIVGNDRKNADIYIKDSSIDKAHLKITSDDEAIFIHNISKDKLTLINEMQLGYEESILIESGDNIKIGKIYLEYY